MSNRSDQVLTDDAKQFIVWAKKKGMKGADIKKYLKEHADIEISDGRISQVWKRDQKKKSIPNENPYEDQVEGFDEPMDDDSDIEEFTHKMVDNALKRRRGSLSPNDIKDDDDDDSDDATDEDMFDEVAPINWKSILETSGLKPIKQKQVQGLIDITDGTAAEVARVLDVAGITYPVQKQILIRGYGLDFANKIMTDRTSHKPAKKQAQDEISQYMNQATSILNQKLRSKQAQLAYEEVNDLLRRIDNNTQGKEEEDPVKLAKDIAVINALNKPEGGFNQKITDALLDNALNKKDPSLLETVRMVLELTKGNNNNQPSDMFLQQQRELNELRRQNSDTQDKMMQRMIDLQSANMQANRAADERLNEQLRASEKEKMELLASQLKEKVEGSVRTYDDFMTQTQSQIAAFKQMGLIHDGGYADQDQQAAVERLKTAEKLVNSIPDKVTDGVDKAVSKIENMMVKYMEYQEKREARQANMMQSPQMPRVVGRTQRSNEERQSILNNIDGRLDNIAEARKQRDRLRELNASY